jgi:hypothetical protein
MVEGGNGILHNQLPVFLIFTPGTKIAKTTFIFSLPRASTVVPKNSLCSERPINSQNMDAVPWVTITHTSEDSALQVHPHVFDGLPLAPTSTPQFVVLVGKHEKSNVLRELLQDDSHYPQLPHGQVYLWPDPKTRLSNTPSIFIDCELHSFNSAQQREPISYTTPELTRKLAWLHYGNQAQTCACFTTNVLFPMSTVLYYFTTDLGGSLGVAKLLATQLSTPPHTEIPRAILPTIVIVTNIDETDEFMLQEFLAQIVLALKTIQPSYTDSEARGAVEKRFGTLELVKTGTSNRFARSKTIRDHIDKMLDFGIQKRRLAQCLFTFNHQQALSDVLLDKFCSEPTSKFSFIKASRPQGFHGDELGAHLDNLLAIIPSEVWLWHFVSPMVASCLLLSLYPPGSHRLYLHSFI